MFAISLVTDFVSHFGVVAAKLGLDGSFGSTFLKANTTVVLEGQSLTTVDPPSFTDRLEFNYLVFWMEMQCSLLYLVFFDRMDRFGTVASICFISNDYRHSEIGTVLAVN